MKIADKLAQIFLGISLFTLLVVAAIRTISSPALLAYEYNKTSFPEDAYGFSQEKRLEYATAALNYATKPLPETYLASQVDDGHPLYNERELSHMVDVQRVFLAVWKAGWAAGILALASGVWLIADKRKRTQIAKTVRSAGIWTAAVLGLIGVLAFVGWDTWFGLFHKLFFIPGSWQFNLTDTLIRLFPTKFWFDSALIATGLIAAGGLILAILGWAFEKWSGKVKPQPRHVAAKKPIQEKPVKKEWPLSVYAWMFGMGLAGYLFGMFIYGDESHPLHWVSAILGLVLGVLIGWLLVAVKDNTRRRPASKK